MKFKKIFQKAAAVVMAAVTVFSVLPATTAFREDTVLKNYPLYCPKCKKETLINAKKLHITVIKEPDA